jgi:hypothetical protein
MNFGRAEQARFQKYILPIFGDFLKKGYSMSLLFFSRAFLTISKGIEDCRACALPEAEGFDHQDVVSNNEGISASLPSETLSEDVSQVQIEHAGVAGPNIFRRSPTSFLSRSTTPTLSSDAMDIDNEVTKRPPAIATSTIPTVHLQVPSVGSTIGPEVQGPGCRGTTLTMSTTGQQVRSKRGPVTDEEGTSRPSKRSKRQHPTQEKGTGSRSASSAQSTRQRNEPAPPQMSVPPAPWFSDLQRMFLEQDLGQDWKNLISSWAAFEGRAQEMEVRRLPTARRPEAVGMWIARKRSLTWRPTIANLENYKNDFNDWWVSLQPTWRVVGGRVDRSLTQGNWDCLRAPGTNGILSIICALFFWGLAAQETRKAAHRKTWLSAVQDCQLAISMI